MSENSVRYKPFVIITRIIKAWFELTLNEQIAVVIIFCLLILGLIARYLLQRQ
jgi:hypothetical protein